MELIICKEETTIEFIKEHGELLSIDMMSDNCMNYTTIRLTKEEINEVIDYLTEIRDMNKPKPPKPPKDREVHLGGFSRKKIMKK